MSLFDQQSREFISRHIGPNEKDTHRMLDAMNEKSLDELIEKTVPAAIRMKHALNIPASLVSMNTSRC